MKTIAFHNLGCKVNSYELDCMIQSAQSRGYNIVDFTQIADIYVINTCTVTNIADRKSRQMLHRAKQRNPEALVVAVGCYVQTDPAGVQADPSVDLAIGNNHKGEYLDLIEEVLRDQEQLPEDVSSRENGAGRGAANLAQPAGANAAAGASTRMVRQDGKELCSYEEMHLQRPSEHTRAYIKIQDGCNQFCTYCAIPYARGRVRSRGRDDILAEIRDVVAHGCKEIVLTGIHISSYGIDFDRDAWLAGEAVPTRKGPSGAADYGGSSLLTDLLEYICDVEGLERVRISSLEPRLITGETARRMAALPKLCPHFHLSLQSGCDATLYRMNRKYNTADFARSVEILRSVFDRPAITTDVIVGFPGETEEEFAQTLEFLRQICFYEMHVFKYSRRKGTVADRLPNQCTAEVKNERSDILLQLTEEQSETFREKYLGQSAQVLWEEDVTIGGKAMTVGHTPDYVRIAVPAAEGLVGTLSRVTVTGFLESDLMVGTLE